MDSVWSSPLLELSSRHRVSGEPGKEFRPCQAAVCSVCGVVELGGILTVTWAGVVHLCLDLT